MQFNLCNKFYSRLMDPIYAELKDVAKKHKNIARIGLLGVGILDTILTITLLAIRAIESLISIPLNIIGAPFFNSCRLVDAKKEVIKILFVPVMILLIPVFIINNIASPKKAETFFV